MTSNLVEAAQSYVGLDEHFKRRMSKDLVALMWGLVLIPLTDDRKRIADHYIYLQEYLKHITDIPMPKMEN